MARGAPQDATRRLAVVAGALYLVTFVASIPALILYGPVLNDPGFVLGSGPDTGILWGGLLEVITAIAGVGTAIALFPVLRRHNEAVALGFIASRGLEAATIVTGVVSLLAVASLRQDLAGAAGADAASLLTAGHALVAVHEWTFLLGPGVMPAVNALLLATLLFRARLVPRIIPAMGLVGAPLLLASSIATLFGAYSQVSVWSAIATIPIFLWELSLGVWLVVKGFTTSPPTAGTGSAGTSPAEHHTA
ncbi:DUF4386 domain-containing protein [Actinomycetospora sp. CA-101289]|uniref:DUF4386 domain-containing protein n=1 Tax=Actinomycetospora sp. CA-101289 TaxID=3239893 RepID=UPI003D982653